MPKSHVIEFGELPNPSTYEEALAFIARMRRRIDRHDVALPGEEGQRLATEYEIRIRAVCDELETEFKKDLGYT